MNKRFGLLFTTVGLACAAIGVGAFAFSKNEISSNKAAAYQLKITDMSKILSDEIATGNGNKISFYTNDFGAGGVLSDGGYLYNTVAISGIESVSVATAQNVKILGGFYQSGTSSIGWETDNPYASGTGTVVADFSVAKPDYFAIVADGADATLTDITVDYGCAAATHEVTIHLYTTNVPNDNDVKVILDSNWTVNDQWINGGGAPWLGMTYVGKSGDYEVFDYTANLPYGLVRFQFAATAGTDDNRTISRYSDWKPYGFYLSNDVELYCYADNGFPANNSSTTTFSVYDHEVTTFSATINLTFDTLGDGVTPQIMFDVGHTIDNDWINNSAPWYVMTLVSGKTYTYTIDGIAEGAELRFQFAAWYNDCNHTLSYESNWKPYKTTVSANVTFTCATTAFPETSSTTNLFTVA